MNAAWNPVFPAGGVLTLGLAFPIEAYAGDVPRLARQVELARRAEALGFAALVPWQLPVASAALALLCIGPLGTALAFWMMLELNRQMSATGMAMATFTVPVAGVLLSWTLLGEAPPAAALPGAALVLLGLGLATARPASCSTSDTLGVSR